MIRVVFSVFLLLSVFELFSQDSLGFFHGTASYYNFKGRGNCSFKRPGKPVLTAAMNKRQYKNAAFCGACLQVIGPKDTVVVKVEDRCPGCKYGGLDLSMTAFATIGDKIKGRIPIKWRVVSCASKKNIVLYTNKGSNIDWTSFIVLNHNYPIKSVAMKQDTSWIPLKRLQHNYYDIKDTHTNSFELRLVDVFNQEIITDSVHLVPGTFINLQRQFAKDAYH